MIMMKFRNTLILIDNLDVYIGRPNKLHQAKEKASSEITWMFTLECQINCIRPKKRLSSKLTWMFTLECQINCIRPKERLSSKCLNNFQKRFTFLDLVQMLNFSKAMLDG